MSDIKLSDVIKIDGPKNYKLHLGTRNKEGVHPLDCFVDNPSSWRIDWNEWKTSGRDDWKRQYVFSLIEFSPKKDSWLFGGVFEVMERLEDKYKLEEVDEFKKFTGRLILSYRRKQGLRGRHFLLENFINDFGVSQILPEVYTGEMFPGYDNVDHDFSVLEKIIKREKHDWKTALQNIKGIYLVTDKSNGKSYIGSAYGDAGIWSRWKSYVETGGHGGNDQLISLIKAKGMDYARQNFKLALLEIFLMDRPDEFVSKRENKWKTILMTKEHGYNSN